MSWGQARADQPGRKMFCEVCRMCVRLFGGCCERLGSVKRVKDEVGIRVTVRLRTIEADSVIGFAVPNSPPTLPTIPCDPSDPVLCQDAT